MPRGTLADPLSLADIQRLLAGPHSLEDRVPGKPPRYVAVQDAVVALSGLYACTALQNPFLVGPYPAATAAADGDPADATAPARGAQTWESAPDVDIQADTDPDAYPAELVIAAHRQWGYMLLGLLNEQGQVERIQVITPHQLAEAASEASYAEFIEERACLRGGNGGRRWTGYYFEERRGAVVYQHGARLRRYRVVFPPHLTLIVTAGRTTSVAMWAVARRPDKGRLDEPLYKMPVGNVYASGWVCLGTIQQSDLAHASPEAVDRLILETSRYTGAAMEGCSRRFPKNVLGLWKEMDGILGGPDAAGYRYPLDDLQRVSTVRHLFEGSLAFTQAL